MGVITAAMRIIYPPQCILCETRVEAEGALCGPCRAEVPFSTGLTCDICGIPLTGDAEDGAVGATSCDDCQHAPRAWARGRAAMLYEGKARTILMGLKHGDRPELARPAGQWMARAGQDLLGDAVLLAPMPLHRKRLRQRGYNQAVLLAQSIARETTARSVPNLLFRNKFTRPLKGTLAERQAVMDGAISHNEMFSVKGERVVVVDDVLTSGASLGAATTALYSAGAGQVDVLVLARALRADDRWDGGAVR